MIKRLNIQIEGIVQGVGFRPFVYALAGNSGLSGWVLNNTKGVEIEVEGDDEDIREFFNSLTVSAPPLSRIYSIRSREIRVKNETGFSIMESRESEGRVPLIPPDMDVCEDCLKELFNPSDRRYRYPFINCTNCGPRFTIIKDIPYDRDKTTMAVFQMCSQCEKEYNDPSDRRFHAQPVGCWQCGPRPALLDQKGSEVKADDPVRETIELLKQGMIVAIKGIGGFHLVVDALSEEAVLLLRHRKHRDEKPFAVMLSNIAVAEQLCFMTDMEKEILLSPAKPIVLLRKRPGHGLAPSVSPGNSFFGVMLPYTPLHHLIMRGNFEALVMTSANISDEPIVKENEEAIRRLAGIADFFLINDREIHIRADDSIVRTMAGQTTVIRRSRGLVPVSIPLIDDGVDVLAVGGELKNTVCFLKEGNAFLSQYIGDMENAGTFRVFKESIEHFRTILQVSPQIIAHDLHPDYRATAYAAEQQGVKAVGVQHHFAHVVSCLAEHSETGPAIGVALDGTGYGDDGNIWGGEFFLFDYSNYERRAHFDYVPMPGGNAAAREPYRMAAAYLYTVYKDEVLSLDLPVAGYYRDRFKTLISMIKKGINCPLTSSCGRLFDAVASMVGIRHVMTFEGQAPMELEMKIKEHVKGSYGFKVSREEGQDCLCISFRDMIRQVVEDMHDNRPIEEISSVFHNTVAEVIADVCKCIRSETSINLAVLSGGVFQNLYLLNASVALLRSNGFRVLTHESVPSNDAGISLGQAVVARARLDRE